MAEVLLDKVWKRFGDVIAVQDFSVNVTDKEFLILLGPSGCGKSTTLRMIAGLEEIDEGIIKIGERVVNDIPPKDRDIAMVFQNYALYPHMDVYNNMAFGLKLRKEPKKEIDIKVKKAARILRIEELLKRKPKALSGGQRQRVALGRAMVRNPKVFLMDEPLSNLDAKLRVQTRTEIAKLHERVATTFVYVTHDQTEAMTMGDRIVIMKDGLIMQTGTPQDVYDNPDNLFVAGFIGSPAMNFMDVVITEDYHIRKGDFQLKAPEGVCKVIDEFNLKGKEVVMGIRPENLEDSEFALGKTEENTFVADIDVVESMGNEVFVYFNKEGVNFTARVNAKTKAKVGQPLNITADLSNMHIFDKKTDKAYI